MSITRRLCRRRMRMGVLAVAVMNAVGLHRLRYDLASHDRRSCMTIAFGMLDLSDCRRQWGSEARSSAALQQDLLLLDEHLKSMLRRLLAFEELLVQLCRLFLEHLESRETLLRYLQRLRECLG